MYTRAYPPRTAPIPQNYGGIAMREVKEPPTAEVEEESVSPPLDGAAEEAFAPTQEPVEHENGEKETFATPEAVATGAPNGERCEKEKLPVSLPSADLLLIALAVLLIQGEKQDNELLIALLFLLLYN